MHEGLAHPDPYTAEAGLGDRVKAVPDNSFGGAQGQDLFLEVVFVDLFDQIFWETIGEGVGKDFMVIVNDKGVMDLWSIFDSAPEEPGKAVDVIDQDVLPGMRRHLSGHGKTLLFEQGFHVTEQDIMDLEDCDCSKQGHQSYGQPHDLETERDAEEPIFDISSSGWQSGLFRCRGYHLEIVEAEIWFDKALDGQTLESAAAIFLVVNVEKELLELFFFLGRELVGDDHRRDAVFG